MNNSFLNPKIQEKIQLQLNALGNRTDFEALREKEDLLGFAENIDSLIYFSKNDPNFDVLDFVSKKEKHKVDIGPLEPELEWDLFDQIRVSKQIPYVTLNTDSFKVEGIKGQYKSSPPNRKFKIYNNNLSKLLFMEEWIEETNVPFSLIMKVLVKPVSENKIIQNEIDIDLDMFDRTSTEKNSYIDVIYNFDRVSEPGLFIRFQKRYSEDVVDQIIEILQSHITGFDLKFKRLTSIAGSFVLDRLLIDSTLFGQLLNENYEFKINPQTMQFVKPTRSFTPIAFLWPNENLKGLSMRKRFILKFKLGDVEAKITISRKQAKTNDVFYSKGAPVTFRKGAQYEVIKISDVSGTEEAHLVKDIISAFLYLYGQPISVTRNNQIITTSRSYELAEMFNLFVYGKPDGQYMGTFFLQSNKIMSKDLANVKKIIERLRKIDPSFYGSIPTGKLVGRRQPIPIVKIDDPNWKDILARMLYETEYDGDIKRQIIRYPFELYDINGELIGEEIVTKVPPYFLITSFEAPYFQLRTNENPSGSNSSIHPYIIQCATKKYVETPGNDYQSRLDALIKGAEQNEPYPLTLIKTGGNAATGDYKKKTFKILKSDYDSGGIPANLEKIFLDAYYGSKIEDISTILKDANHGFTRTYAPRIQESILHLLCLYGGRPEIREIYNKITDEDRKVAFLKTTLKKFIADRIDWNIVRQEMYDMDALQAKEYFMSKDIFIDPHLFKSVLEKIFNVFILVFTFDGKHVELELPRHKFFHVSQHLYANNVSPLVIFKHDYSTSSKFNFPHCEAIFMNNEYGQALGWNLLVLQNLFNRANKTLDISFYDAHHIRSDTYLTAPTFKPDINLKADLTEIFDPTNLTLQCIDGAGKVRAVIYNYTNQDSEPNQIAIMCEPLRPINLPSFNDPLIIQKGYDPSKLLEPESFEKALAFVQSLGVKDFAFKLDSSSDDLYEFSNETLKPKSIRRQTLELELKESKRTIQERTKKSSRRKEKKSEEVQINLPKNTIMGLEEMLRQTVFEQPEVKPFVLTETPKIEDVIRERSKNTSIETEDALAIGIWFKLKDVEFFIATNPGEIPFETYAINNDSYLEPGPEHSIFWQHDYYERVMNVLIQLVRNLYLYSRVDDPYYFATAMITIIPNNIYEISGIRRRLPKYQKEKYLDFVQAYAKQYPSFFKSYPNRIPAIIADSQKTFEGLYQHIKQLQTLKLEIFGASGSKIERYEYVTSNGTDRIKVPLINKENGAKMIKYYPHVESESPENIEVTNKGFPFVKNQVSLFVTDYMIEKIEQFDELFNRPEYLEEFFVNPSDFTIRGPDQQVFINELDLKDFLTFTDFEEVTNALAPPLSQEVSILKIPQYVILEDQSIYLLQNVLGGNKLRAINVIMFWEQSKINLGYYADEWDGPIPSYADWPYIDTSMNREGFNGKPLSSTDKFALLKYKVGQYAALLRISYRGEIESISVTKGI